MAEFYVGATVENINEDSERYGDTAKVISYSRTNGIAVQYEDGYVGKAMTASRYYEVLNDTPCGRANTASGSPKTGFMNEVAKAVKRALMSANTKALVDTGLMDECGNYTCTALGILAQAAAEADVALGANSVLVAAANATLAERKAKKGDN